MKLIKELSIDDAAVASRYVRYLLYRYRNIIVDLEPADDSFSTQLVKVYVLLVNENESARKPAYAKYLGNEDPVIQAVAWVQHYCSALLGLLYIVKPVKNENLLNPGEGVLYPVYRITHFTLGELPWSF